MYICGVHLICGIQFPFKRRTPPPLPCLISQAPSHDMRNKEKCMEFRKKFKRSKCEGLLLLMPKINGCHLFSCV